MANTVKGEVGFEADGENYVLVFDFNAICDLEDEFSVSASQLGDVIGDSLRNLRKVFRVGLARHHNVDDRTAGDILSALGAEKAGDLIAESFAASFPQAKGTSGNGRAAKRR